MVDGDPPTSSLPYPLHGDGLKSSTSTQLPTKTLFSDLVKSHSLDLGIPTVKLPFSGTQPSVDIPSAYQLKPTATYQNKPAVLFTTSDKKKLLGTMNHVLIGKFSHGRPSFGSIKDFFVSLKLRGNYNLSIFDPKHIFIECESKADFTRLWLGLIWHIQGSAMRVFKWDSDFTPSKESPRAPVWVRFEGLPLFFFEENSLLSIANSIGNPLKVDPRNINRINLRSARICVDLNVSQPLVDAIWVCFVDGLSQDVMDAFLVRVYYDCVPSYCTLCAHVCHREEDCKRRLENDSAVGKLFDKSSQLGISDVGLSHKVFDGLPQPRYPRNNGLYSAQYTRKNIVSRVWQPIENKAHCKGTDSALVANACSENSLSEITTQIGQLINRTSLQELCSQGPKAQQDSTYCTDSTLVTNACSENSLSEITTQIGQLINQTSLQELCSQGPKAQQDSAYSGPDLGSSLQQGKQDASAQAEQNIRQQETQMQTDQQASTTATQCAQTGQNAIIIEADLDKAETVTTTNPGQFLDRVTYSAQPAELPVILAEVPEGQHSGGEIFTDEGVNHIESSDVQSIQAKFLTPNKKRLDLPSLGKSGDNGILQGKYTGFDLIDSQQEVDSFTNDVAELRDSIDKADSATLERMRKSPATKVFFKTHFERCILFPLPMTDLRDNEDTPDTCTKSELSEGGQPTNMVLPKLCFEQVSKSQDAQKWRTTVQIAPIFEGPGIVKAALLHLAGKERVSVMRDGFPFDDKG